MDQLHQNCLVCTRIFSSDNPNRVCKHDSATCQLCASFLIVLIGIFGITLIYFTLIGVGFITSLSLNYNLYNISSGCTIKDLNCPKSLILCSARTYHDIFGFCVLSGIATISILSISALFGLPILWCIWNTVHYIIKTIFGDIYDSFIKTKENMVIPNDEL